MRWSHGSFCQERALQTAERSEGVWRREGSIAILLHSAIAPFSQIAVSLMESSLARNPSPLLRIANASAQECVFR